MPNFNVHWLVANEAIRGAPEWIANGQGAYARAAGSFSDKVKQELNKVGSLELAKAFCTTITAESEKFQKALTQNPKDHADATCYSAYMLGACGPDFWTLPSKSKGLVPFFATHHFNLGHYNRTHQQFAVSVDRLVSKDKSALQARVEMAYFYGMATHFAADLVIHQLVNVSAGAYNLLEKLWENENGFLGSNLWSTHNKVEHYWDTYVRLRYLGDFGPVFGTHDEKNWFSPMNLPVVETLMRKVQSAEYRAGLVERVKQQKPKPKKNSSEYVPKPEERAQEIIQALERSLRATRTRAALEKPLVFPQLFADRLEAGHMTPFIYAVVVNKKTGAYPTNVVPAAVDTEATSPQMGVKGKYSELNKTSFYSSPLNEGTDNCGYNYLTYIVCPNLEQVRQYGRDVFYHLDALKPFVDRAVAQAKVFVGDLSSAYGSGSLTSLHPIARFWNLDTGLGLRVVNRPSDTPNEVITRLDFVHVFDWNGGGLGNGVGYARQKTDTYIGNKPAQKWTFEEGSVFPGFSASPFNRLADVEEEKGSYLDKIRLASPAPEVQSWLKVDDEKFFPKRSSSQKKSASVASAAIKKQNKIAISEVAHRLNLELRIALPKLGEEEQGMFFYGDRKGVAQPYQNDNKEETKTWLGESGKGARMLDHAQEGKAGPAGLRFFTTRLLANLEPSKDLKSKENGWNNVIPYRENEKNYGRNFAISTGRDRVLHPVDSGNFDERNHFAHYSNASPTEQVFFTVYPLVCTPDGVFDVFSKDPVSKDKMEEIRRIASVGFVKIVLYYELRHDGACQLAECYIDGLRVPVEEDLSA